MDPLFVATATESEIGAALRLWPELADRRVRPLLVSAFGEIFVETDGGDVWSADPIEIRCERIADTVTEFETLLSNPAWARERLLTEVAMLARDRGIERPQHQVFAVAPHPCLTGSIEAGTLVPTDLLVWHDIVSQLREPNGMDSPPQSP